MNIFFAPLQGYTDAAYQRFHNEVYGGCIDCYYTPFLRVENGALRMKDTQEVKQLYISKINVVPQIIVKDINEFRVLIDAIRTEGYREIDINMGCPFPMQVKKGRGAGLILNTDNVIEIFNEISANVDIQFSLKMRLGVDKNNQWKSLCEVLNSTPLKHITLHPRIAKQQYKGNVDFDSFIDFYNSINHNIVYNGDITDISQVDDLITNYPKLYGIMIGRGLLARPSMAIEYKKNLPFTHQQQMEKLLLLHTKLFHYYSSKLSGESHLLIKMKTFWDYSEPLIGRKSHKLIKKASTLDKYNEVINNMLDFVT